MPIVKRGKVKGDCRGGDIHQENGGGTTAARESLENRSKQTAATNSLIVQRKKGDEWFDTIIGGGGTLKGGTGGFELKAGEVKLDLFVPDRRESTVVVDWLARGGRGGGTGKTPMRGVPPL